MAMSATQFGVLVAVLGTISFILGVIAENKKAPYGTPVEGKDEVVCNYPSTPFVALGWLSVVFLAISSGVGLFSLFYPYKGKAVPRSVFFNSKPFSVFFTINLFTVGLGAALTLSPVVQEQYHLNNKVHPISTSECPTGKTGMIGGGAFVSLDATLLWLVLLLLASNIRQDFFYDSDFQSTATTPPPQHVAPVDLY